jgi:hypothetical protein
MSKLCSRWTDRDPDYAGQSGEQWACHQVGCQHRAFQDVAGSSADPRWIVSRRSLLAILAAMPLASKAAGAAPSRADRIMVQARPQDTASLYKVRNILPALDQLGGVRKIRCREPYKGTPGWHTYTGLARAGVRFCFTLSGREVARSVADLKAFLAQAPRSIWAIEFPNEPDLNPVTYKGMKDRRLGFRTGNAPAFMGFVAEFFAAARAEPALRTIPLIASNDFMQREQARFTDLGNSHIYPRADTNIANKLAGFQRKLAQGGHARGVITEWGRTTGGGLRNLTAPPVSEAQQANLLATDVRMALEQPFVQAINLYELFCWRGEGEMQNFGLFDNDLSPRPVVGALRGLLL